MASPEAAQDVSRIKVLLVYSPAPRQVRQWALVLDLGATVATALSASRVTEAFPELQLERPARLRVGVWGQKCSPSRVLQDADRVEIYRPLRVDPKVARRERFNRQGAKTAGLFAKNRPGGKAGY